MLLKKMNLFLEMDGYSFFIWSSYAVWLILLLLITLKVILRKKNIEKKLRYVKSSKNNI